VIGSDRHGDEVIGEQQKDDQGGCDHEGMREEEGQGEEPRHLDRLDDLVERVGVHALVDAAARLDGGQDVEQTGCGQHDAGGGPGHIRRGGDGDADLGLLERGCVVHAVAGHTHDVPGSLQGLDEMQLVLGKDARQDRALRVERRTLGRERGGIAHQACDADLFRNGAPSRPYRR